MSGTHSTIGDRVTVTEVGQDAQMGCTSCNQIETVRLDPLVAMLHAIQAFVARHADCPNARVS